MTGIQYKAVLPRACFTLFGTFFNNGYGRYLYIVFITEKGQFGPIITVFEDKKQIFNVIYPKTGKIIKKNTIFNQLFQ